MRFFTSIFRLSYKNEVEPVPQFQRAFRKLSPLLEQVTSLDPAVKCRLQEIFENLRVNRPRPSAGTLWQKTKFYSAHAILSLVSLFTLIRMRWSPLPTAHYQIDILNGPNGYDARAQYIFQELDTSQTLNFFHVFDLGYSVGAALRKKNPLYFESLFVFLKPFFRKRVLPPSLENQLSRMVGQPVLDRIADSSRLIRMLDKILGWAKVRTFVFIDDSRHTAEIRHSCRNLGIPLLGYMHARFNEFHIGLYTNPMDGYLVWSDYFKKKAEDLFVGEKPKILVTGHPRISALPELVFRENKEITVVWVEETNIDPEELVPYWKSLLQSGTRVVFRRKPGAPKVDFPPEFVLDQSADFFACLKNNKVTAVLATHSTVLMESWLVGVPSIFVESKYDYGQHLVRDGLALGPATPPTLHSWIEKAALLSERELLEKRQEIWGDCVYRPQVVRGLLRTYPV